MIKITNKQILDFSKSFLRLVSTLFMISMITFSLVKLSPGDPAENYLRASHVAITTTTVEKAREELGLNKSLLEQYTGWVRNAIKGDLGISYMKKTSVLTMIKESTKSTFEIGLLAFFILVIASTTLGVLSALYKNKFLDYLIQLFSFMSASIPTFWLGYLLIIVFAVKLKIFPVSGRSGFASIILPCITLVIPIIGQTTLIIRKTILAQMDQLHVENAVVCGVRKSYIIKNHLLKNALIPIITVFSSNILYLITGSILIEEVFAYPGLGKMFTTAVKGGDMPVIQGSLLLFGVMAIIINASTEVFVNYINPQKRTA